MSQPALDQNLTETQPAPLALLNGDAEGQEENKNGHRIEFREDKRVRRHWNLSDSRIVAIEVARLMRKQGFPRVPDRTDRVGGRFMNDFVNTAQLLLPRELRRPRLQRTQLNMIFWKLVEDALRTKADLVPKAPVPAPEMVAPESVVSPAGGAVETPTPPTHPVPPAGYALVAENDPLASVPMPALAQAFFSRLLAGNSSMQARLKQTEEATQLVMDELAKVTQKQEQIFRRLADVDTALQNLPAREKLKLPRVAIVGCRQDVFAHIVHGAEVHGLKLDFRLYEQGEHATHIDADWAIAMRWTAHKHTKQIQEAIPSKQSAFVDGGVTAAIAQLRTWFQPGFKP